MTTARLGRTGLQVSRLCLGTMTFGWSVDAQTAFTIMDAAYRRNITFFDTANMYSAWVDGNSGGESEVIIGKWLARQRRQDIVIASKVRGRMWTGNNGEGLSRHHIIQSVEDSLRRLRTDYIDLYQAHWYDENTRLEETLYAFETLIQSGKVRYVGCSNYPAWRLTKACWIADVHKITRYDSIQPHYSLFNRKEYETELADLCADQQIGVIPYSAMAAGFATGKYTRDNMNPHSTRTSGGLIQRLVNDPTAFNALDVIREIATKYSVPMGQIAVAWLLHQPNITAPIIGARTVEQLTEIAGAVDVVLSDEDMKQLDEATKHF
ncbi:MAG: aldo/keto reductase [Phototrophicaceae bacterium]